MDWTCGKLILTAVDTDHKNLIGWDLFNSFGLPALFLTDVDDPQMNNIGRTELVQQPWALSFATTFEKE